MYPRALMSIFRRAFRTGEVDMLIVVAEDAVHHEPTEIPIIITSWGKVKSGRHVTISYLLLFTN